MRIPFEALASQATSTPGRSAGGSAVVLTLELLGVGWRRTTHPLVVLRKRAPAVPPDLFPTSNPTPALKHRPACIAGLPEVILCPAFLPSPRVSPRVLPRPLSSFPGGLGGGGGGHLAPKA